MTITMDDSGTGVGDPFILRAEHFEGEIHTLFKLLRGKYPFVRTELGSVMVLRYKHVEALLTDPRTRQLELEGMHLQGVTDGALFDLIDHAMLFANGEEHQRRRAPVSRTFAFALMKTLRPRVQDLARSLAREYKAGGEMDVRDGYAKEIPSRIICEILGVPQETVPQFIEWVEWAARGIGFFDHDDLPKINDATAQLMDFVQGLLSERRANPRDDFLTDYVRATDAAGILSPEEVYTQIGGVILAGSDTTRTGTSSLVSLLMQHRDQWEAICADPGLIRGAVAEGLRYEPPVGSLPRFALEDIEIEGDVIEAGQFTELSSMSALRDEAVYAEPDRFDITREDHPRWHLVFGGGAHRCLGEALAWIEMEEAIGALATELPGMALTSPPPQYFGASGIRRIGPVSVGF